jgi:hypothetical protein
LDDHPDRKRDRHRAHTLFRSVSRGSFGLAHVHVRSPDLRAGDGDDDIGRPEYAYPVAGNSDALYGLRKPEPSQSFPLIASSAAGYTSVPLVSTCAPGVSFAGSTLPLPMMCMTGTPRASR